MIKIKRFGIKQKTKQVKIEDLFKNVVILEYDSGIFSLKIKRGRPKTFFHYWVVEQVLEIEKLTYENLLKLDIDDLKKSLDFIYGKQFIESDDYEKIIEYAENNSINIKYKYE
jgi:hypothetical protein